MIKLLSIFLMLAGAIQAQIPQTAAGRQFAAWLAAVNSGDRATTQQFVDKSMPGRSVDQTLAIATRTGGFIVKKVEESSNARIVVLAQERGPSAQFARISLDVAADAPDHIAGIRVEPTEPPADLAPPKLTAAEIEAARNGAPFRQFSAWLQVFDAGDTAEIRRYLTANYPSANIGSQLAFRNQTGGFDFRALEHATPTTIVGLVEDRNSDQFAQFNVTVDTTEAHRIARFGVMAIPRPAESPFRE